MTPRDSKYDIYNILWFIQNSKAVSDRVTSVKFVVIGGSQCHIDYFLSDTGWKNEREVFATKQDLINSL